MTDLKTLGWRPFFYEGMNTHVDGFGGGFQAYDAYLAMKRTDKFRILQRDLIIMHRQEISNGVMAQYKLSGDTEWGRMVNHNDTASPANQGYIEGLAAVLT